MTVKTSSQDTDSATLSTRWTALSSFRSDQRFRLYVSYACPWSHRVLIARELRSLDHAIEVVNVEPEMNASGWRQEDRHLADIYRHYAPGYTGKATVPLLINPALGEVVSNESADLIRMLGSNDWSPGGALFPAQHAEACEAWNDDIQANVNTRVYQYGFAASSDKKSAKTASLMKQFEPLDLHLATHRYLVTDDRALEPDWRLWTTLARYDLAYRPFLLGEGAAPLAHFSNLARFFAELLAVPGIAATYRASEIQSHYAARVRDAKPADDQTQGDNR
ncbi:MAG: glutathione S-transferase N-terminal domain-containing protein [Phycisphaerales bacterium]|nr:glutathione S-transferase N-terminal domain-containing protein [Hyphomonadaceae bacterium]